ncbi:MAG: TonB-dependent receptor [Marinilabiliaceae bacterium]|nr:TonB-dependent receptor [Marinilabiliaceae bacterium]
MKKLMLRLLLFVCATNLLGQTKQYTICGYVSDAGSGEKLINANVYEPKGLIGSVSNTYGFYSLTLPAGQYTIVYSFVGFETKRVNVDLNQDKEINITLAYAAAIDEVTVVGGAVNNKLDDTQMSKEVITMETVKSLPAFMGEADVIKTMQLLPGVQSGNEASSGLYVRGGGPDQNLILLDGVPVYNANHLFGFFSVFNTDAIKNLSLYKGGFPARFGGRLSSVVDIRMKEGNEKEFHGGVQVGLIASKFHLEGPIQKDKTAFHISGRRTYIDVLTRPLMPKDNFGGYFFYDLNAKVNHKFSDRSRIYLSAYTGRDKAFAKYDESYSSGEESYHDKDKSHLYWGNITTALRWNYVFNNKLFSNTTVTYSQYKFNVENEAIHKVDNKVVDDIHYKYKSGINDVSYKMEFDWYPSNAHEIKFGVNYIYHTFNPGVEAFRKKSDYEQPFNKTFGDDEIYAHELNFFMEDNIQLSDRLKANLGLHFSGFNVENTFYTSLEPRISMRYVASDRITLKAAYSKMQQYLHLLSNSTIGMPTDLWVPVTEKIKPQMSHQYAIGAVYSPVKKYTFSVEGFYKDMKNLIEYKEGASFFGSSVGWEDKVEMGDGRSFGMEVLLKKESGKTTGWIGYTLSKSERQFERLNFGEWFPARHDRTHDLSVVMSHKFSDKIDIGATWVFGTGNAITLATHDIQPLQGEADNDYDVDNSSVPYFEHRNNYRMPDYHRLDFGVNFHKKKKRGTRTWNISVYNVYNRKNPFFLYVGNKDDGGKVLKQISLFPILPSISYTYKF